MKKTVLLSILFSAFILSCEKAEVIDPGINNNPDYKVDPEVLFRIGDGTEFRFNDIELYDSSTHILYFKKEQARFGEILNKPFAFLNKGDTIYSGLFWPGYFSSIPIGPIILSPPNMYGNHALRIEVWMDDKPDVRNCPELTGILKEHNLLHSGLDGHIDSIEISDTLITFRFTVINRDVTDLLILDINKTGPNLFHYFTNGLYLRRPTHENAFSGTIPHQKPDPWNSWKPEWLSLLKSGDSVSFVIEYPVETPVGQGEYHAIFEFPGLAYQVTKAQLLQGKNRIWLGDITLRKNVVIH